MTEAPSLIVWHPKAEAYQKALGARLPAVRIQAREDPSDSTASPGVEVLVTWRPVHGALLALPDLRWVQVTGAGIEHMLARDDLAEGVLLTRSLGRFGVQVAEYAIGYLLHHLLEIDKYRADQHARRWQQRSRPLLADCTVGIVGLGSLGRILAERVAAFGSRVLGVRSGTDPVAGVDALFTLETWHQMLPECQALLLATPLTPDTAGMLDAEALSLLPEGATVVNVARGELIDREALVEALGTGRLGSVVLDVFSEEPLPPEDPLWQQEKAWITPHIAAPSEVEGISDEIAANYRRYVAGQPLLNLIDRRRGY